MRLQVLGSSQQTIRKKPILAGTTPPIAFGLGFDPATLTMSVYDVDFSVNPATQAIVNERNDIDISEFVDSAGNVALTLEDADTAVTVPQGARPATIQRRILFAWTLDDTVGKHELVLTIAPDRETVAT